MKKLITIGGILVALSVAFAAPSFASSFASDGQNIIIVSAGAYGKVNAKQSGIHPAVAKVDRLSTKGEKAGILGQVVNDTAMRIASTTIGQGSVIVAMTTASIGQDSDSRQQNQSIWIQITVPNKGRTRSTQRDRGCISLGSNNKKPTKFLMGFFHGQTYRNTFVLSCTRENVNTENFDKISYFHRIFKHSRNISRYDK